MNAPRFLRILLAVVSAIGFASCDRQAGTSDEHETTVAARLFQPDGSPASGARIKIYAVADTSKAPRDQVFAAADGSVSLPTDLPAGEYNLVVNDGDGNGLVIDSLLSKGAGAPQLRSDTLRPMGILTGRLQVEPQHSPRIAWVQILGTGLAANVDTAGTFLLEVPAGRITLAALTRDPNYTPTFRTVKTIPDSILDVGTMRMEYTGIPVVQGLNVTYDTTTGVARISWKRSDFFGAYGYRLEKGAGQRAIFLHRSEDTVVFDTLFRLDDGPTALTVQRRYTVVALDSSLLDGPAWSPVSLQVLSPWLLEPGRVAYDTLGRFPEGCFEVDTLGTGLACILKPYTKTVGDTLGIAAYVGMAPGYRGWTSADGLAWRQVPSLPDTASAMVAWKGLIWVAKSLETGDSAPSLPAGTFGRDILLPLVDGVVVEAWSPQGSLVRRDTFLDEANTFGHRLLVRGDSLLLATDSVEYRPGGGPMPGGLMPVVRSFRALEDARSAWGASFSSTFPGKWATMIRNYLETMYTPFSGALLAQPRPSSRWNGMDVVAVGQNVFGRTGASVFPKWIAGSSAFTPMEYRGDGENVPPWVTWNGCGILQLLNVNRLLRVCPVE